MKKTVMTLALLAATPAMAEPLRIATEGAYPPFNEVNAAGELVGFDVDIANALCAKMEAECVIVAQDWDGIIPGLTAGKYDAIIASMSITEERLQTVDFTDPYYSNFLVVVAKDGSGVTSENVKEYSVGAQRSTIAAVWAEEQMGTRGDLRLYDTTTASFADLEAGRIDAFVADYFPAVEWLKDNAGFSIAGDRIDIDDKIGIAIRQNEGELKDALNAALNGIIADGTYGEISTQYFGVDIY
ncbi:transporter substrate-binding domain-containing protein [Actibacterium pelagium]|uniref:Amino acid ABC transporter n=1 Tax=Actibacterium pelagium TaxID=2029103 RepID=A0A917AN31_9RHOB|nr:transporter substrate-binding domain-containing protein [Actibacterium pelagium]GGE61722.1 amino acid ABC transporter [Actibacterium pelagium]